MRRLRAGTENPNEYDWTEDSAVRVFYPPSKQAGTGLGGVCDEIWVSPRATKGEGRLTADRLKETNEVNDKSKSGSS
jgi:hypothetical protein